MQLLVSLEEIRYGYVEGLIYSKTKYKQRLIVSSEPKLKRSSSKRMYQPKIKRMRCKKTFWKISLVDSEKT